jgi:biotin carboxyl carrier protein
MCSERRDGRRRRARWAALGLAAALLLTASGCEGGRAAEPKLMTAKAERQANDVTSEAVRGALRKEYSMSAVVQYPGQKVVRLEAAEAQFVEFTVTNGQQVRAGETLAVFRKKADSVRLTAIGLEMEALETERRDGLYDREKADEALRKEKEELDNLPSDRQTYRVFVQKETIEKKLRRSEAERQRFEGRIDQRRRELEEERADILKSEEDLKVVSPMDGVVGSLQYIAPGVTCGRGQVLMNVYDPEEYLLFSGEGITGAFRVGQTVEVEYGRNNDRSTAAGRVVAADALLDTALRRGGAYIALDGEIPAEKLLNPTVRAEQIRLDGVLLLPRNAVGHENGIAYVRILSGGSPRKRYVLTGPSDAENTMVLGGIDEGQIVVVD